MALRLENDVKLHAGTFLARPVAVDVPIKGALSTNGALPAVQAIIKHEAIHNKVGLEWGSNPLRSLFKGVCGLESVGRFV